MPVVRGQPDEVDGPVDRVIRRLFGAGPGLDTIRARIFDPVASRAASPRVSEPDPGGRTVGGEGFAVDWQMEPATAPPRWATAPPRAPSRSAPSQRPTSSRIRLVDTRRSPETLHSGRSRASKRFC